MNRLSITRTFDVLWQQQVCHEKGTKWETSYKRDLRSNYGYSSRYLSLSSYNIVFCLFNIFQTKIFYIKPYVWNGLLQKKNSNKTVQTFPRATEWKYVLHLYLKNTSISVIWSILVDIHWCPLLLAYTYLSSTCSL